VRCSLNGTCVREWEQALEAIAQQIVAIKRHAMLDDRRLASAKRLLLRQTLVEMWQDGKQGEIGA
jgi:hypothetical protein